MKEVGNSRGDKANLIEWLNKGFAAIAGWSFDHRWWVVVGCLLLAVGSVVAVSTVRIDNTFENYFDPQDPTYTAYDRFRKDFGSDEMSYILYEVPGVEYGPWNLEVMRKVVDLTRALEDEVPFVADVTSLANAEYIQGVEDGIEIYALQDRFPESQSALLALREQYLAKPMLVGGILNAEADYAAILVEMLRTSTDPLDLIRLDPDGGDGLENLYPQAAEAKIQEILSRPEYAEMRFYHSGDVPLNATFNRIIGTESNYLAAIASLVIGLLLFFFFRSFVGTAAPLAVIQLTVLACVGFIAAMGWHLDMGFGIIPNLLMAIGVAHSVHILSEFRFHFVEIGERRAALVKTLYLVGTPCLLTSLTTAVGFLSMSFAPIKSLARMGVYSSFGVLAAFVLSLTLLMAFLSFGRSTPSQKNIEAQRLRAKGGRAIHGALNGISDFAIRNRRAALVVSALLFVCPAWGSPVW